MARSLNKVLLIGNLGADPEIRTAANGTKVVGLSIATNRSWPTREGETHERTEWHRVVAWGSLAEVAEQYLGRGDRVYVEGELQYRSYQDRYGVTRHMSEIRAAEMVMLGGRGTATAPEGSGAPSRVRQPVIASDGAKGSSTFVPTVSPADDLPF